MMDRSVNFFYKPKPDRLAIIPDYYNSKISCNFFSNNFKYKLILYFSIPHRVNINLKKKLEPELK